MQHLLRYVVLAAFAVAHAVSCKQHEVDKDLSWWGVLFFDEQLNMTMGNSQTVSFKIDAFNRHLGDSFEFHVLSDNDEVAQIVAVKMRSINATGTVTVRGSFTLQAQRLGYTHVFVELRRTGQEAACSEKIMRVIVTQPMNLADIIFKFAITCFVMVIYVNFGAVFDMEDLKRIVTRPVGPAIGLFCQFLVMPVLSFLICYFLFPEMIELRLGLFFLGVSPAGGSLNIFTMLLNGNLNLSITMTALSNLAALGMMPLWIFTLGALIYRDDKFEIPSICIESVLCGLVVPIAIGVLLQMYAPKVTKKMSKLLKPVSLVLILAITISGCVHNSYMWKLFTTKILIGSCILPWLGYVIGWVIATVLRQPSKDDITTAIVAGIQNIGIAIFMLELTLPQPQADMTRAVLMANSMVTSLPLLLIYFLKLCFCRKHEKSVDPEAVTLMVNGMEKTNSKHPQ